MSNIGVVDWFTKEKKKVEYPGQSDKLLDELLKEIIDKFNSSSKMSHLADSLYEILENNELLNDISSDSRLPVCSLFHHLKNTSGVAVCLLKQSLDKDASFMQKTLAEYNVTAEYDEKDLVALMRIAALLHDIGKPRSYTSSSRSNPYHYHTTQGREILEYILKNSTSPLVGKFQLDRILPLMSSRHHSRDSQTRLERLLGKADSVASAADRINEVKTDLDLKKGTLEIRNNDRIFPHEINFDAAGLKCLETPHTCILGKDEIIKRKISLKKTEDYVQPYIDNTSGGGPSLFLRDGEVSRYFISGNIGILSLDMMSIQGFVAEADKLNMLRGGSYLVDHILEQAEKIIARYVCKEAVLFRGGGNLLSFIPDIQSLKNEIKQNIESEIYNMSKGGLGAAVIMFSTELDELAGNFHSILDISQQKLEISKNKTTIQPVIDDAGKICKHCSVRTLSDHNDKCEVCMIKEEAGKKHRFTMSRKYIPDRHGHARPEEMSHLGTSVAAVVMDGNMMGRMFQQTTTPAEYTFKSKSFADRFDAILKSTIDELRNNDDFREKYIVHSGHIGLEVVYAGGDDVLLLMNAKAAIPFAEQFIRNIAEEFKFKKTFFDGSSFSNPVITVSCGIAIADDRFPLYFLLNAARKMESRAKEAFREDTYTDDLGIIRLPYGSIAFTGISSAMPTEDSSCFVIKEKSEDPSFDGFKSVMEMALEKKELKSVISDMVTCGGSELERLNLIKFIYSSISRKSSGLNLDNCEWMAGVLMDENALKASRMMIPHLLHGDRGAQ